MGRLLILGATVVLVGVLWTRTNRTMEERVQRATASLQVPDIAIRGTWAAERYVLAGGEVHPVRGRIVFGEGEWQVLFFVLDSAGVARRGSAEGGAYTARGDTVTFRHHYNLSAGDALAGLPESPLRMEVTAAAKAAREPARFEVAGERLILRFPSGNSMEFRRVEEWGESG